MVQKTGLIAIAVVAIVIIAAAAYLVTQPAAPGDGEEGLKVAVLFNVPLSDPWASMAWVGIEYIRDELGAEIAYSELVSDADAERIMRGYAAAGYDLIFGHSFGFQSAIFAVAPDFPDTAFAWNDGYETLPNACVYEILNHESGYLAGLLAGGMSESGIIGAIGGMPVPDVVRSVEGYRLGAKAVDPDITVLTTYLGSWIDTVKGKEAALAMIDAGADFVYTAASSAGLGGIEAGEEHGVYIIGDTADQNAVSPDIIITSVLLRHSIPIIAITEDVIAGTFEGKFYTFGMAEDASDIAPYHGLADVIPDALKDRIDQAREDILAGDLVIQQFTEPQED